MRSVRRGGLVEQVIEELSAAITSGEWAVGDRLPATTKLAETLDVGQSTVREAVQALAHRGVLEVHQGRGTFVADPGSSDDRSARWLRRAAVLDLYEARRGLEVDAARLAALRRTEDDVALLEAAAAARRDARTRGVVAEWASADLALHHAVLAATHNPVLIRLFDELADAMTAAFEEQTTDPEAEVDTAGEHEELVAAIVAGDPAAAMRATIGYLEASEQELRRLGPGS